jgi:hypothetical protein
VGCDGCVRDLVVNEWLGMGVAGSHMPGRDRRRAMDFRLHSKFVAGELILDIVRLLYIKN